MKKKVLSLCLVAMLALTAVVGGTMAYFTDTDNETNTFTVGNVDIDLIEDFEQGSKLNPGDKNTNAVNKDAWVKNEGNNDAWIRVKVYVPSALDQLTTPQYTEDGYLVAAAYNTVHWNTVKGNEAIWNVEKANVEAVAVTEGEYAGYNEYVFYYNEIVPAGATTEQLLEQVYLDSKVDYDVENGYYTINGEEIKYDFANGVDIKVVAEAIQAEGFTTYEAAFAAFDAQK